MAAASRLSRSGLRSFVGEVVCRSGSECCARSSAIVELEMENVRRQRKQEQDRDREHPRPQQQQQERKRDEDGGSPQWVFLGCPGVGKGTNASRLAKFFDIPHIAMGDIVRQELKSPSFKWPISSQLTDDMTRGKLLPDDVIFDLLSRRLEREMSIRERGFILDGFPRTVSQARILDGVADIDLVINLQLREDVIVAKCLGRRICSQCGGNFNLANIDVGGRDGEPRTLMPPHLPPSACLGKMTIRPDDTEEVVRARLHIYHQQSAPVETFYRTKGKLLDFKIGGGIVETSSDLLAALILRAKLKRLGSSSK